MVAFQALEDHLDLVVPCLALVDQLIEVLEDPYLNQEVRLLVVPYLVLEALPSVSCQAWEDQGPFLHVAQVGPY